MERTAAIINAWREGDDLRMVCLLEDFEKMGPIHGARNRERRQRGLGPLPMEEAWWGSALCFRFMYDLNIWAMFKNIMNFYISYKMIRIERNSFPLLNSFNICLSFRNFTYVVIFIAYI